MMPRTKRVTAGDAPVTAADLQKVISQVTDNIFGKMSTITGELRKEMRAQAEKQTGKAPTSSNKLPRRTSPRSQGGSSSSTDSGQGSEISEEEVSSLTRAAALLRKKRGHDEAAGGTIEEEEEELLDTRVKRGRPTFTSGRKWTDTAEVKVKVVWPNQDVFSVETGTRPAPEELSLAQLIYGYTAQTMRAEPDEALIRNRILLEILDDAQAYRWEKVRAGHYAFLEQIEQGTIQWDDVQGRAEIRRKLIWPHPAAAGQFLKKPISAGTAKQSSTPCSYCLEKTGGRYFHKVVECNRKQRDAKAPPQPSGN